MKRRVQTLSPKGKIIVNKLDPGIFVVEIPKTGRKISLGQPPDVIKRFQQVGYYSENAVDSFVIIDSKIQDDSICWVLAEFPILYALYLRPVVSEGKTIPAFFAKKYPRLIGLENDLKNALTMIKYGNYGLNDIEELDQMDIPTETRDALRKEILGLAVGNKILNSETFISAVPLMEFPSNTSEFSDLGDHISIGRIASDKYKVIFENDSIDINTALQKNEKYHAPIEYTHFKFPVVNFGIWHTGENDGMDPYFSGAHTSLIHKYEPILIDYPSNMTDVINHNGLSKKSINTILVTHNHDDHIGGMVELFRRTRPCMIITTEPVKYSVVKKLAALVNLPENIVENSFHWTILPFKKDNPYQTETYNLDGIAITGHLSCHSVPTTIYTTNINYDGLDYSYAHFLDIVSFKRMQTLVNNSWMPADHLEYLDKLIRGKQYNLLKYDAGCPKDEDVPFSVHGQWQDLKNAKTERSFRLFTHVSQSLLADEYKKEGRFVRIGDLDTAIKSPTGKLVQFGVGMNYSIPFYYQAYNAIVQYFESLIPESKIIQMKSKIQHYAFAFANSPKQSDLNIGYYLIEQGDDSHFVYVIIRGRAVIRTYDKNDQLVHRSTVGDGEVIGDIGALADNPRMASVQSLNRLSYVAIPSSLFKEAMLAMKISYEGRFKEIFERRLLFQSAHNISQDVSTIILNEIAGHCISRQVNKGDLLIKTGEDKNHLVIFDGKVTFQYKNESHEIQGPSVIGEYESLWYHSQRIPGRPYSVIANEKMHSLIIDTGKIWQIPVIMDNIRRIIQLRNNSIYKQFN